MCGIRLLDHPGVLDVRGRRDFSRFDPRPGRPHFSKFGQPAERRPFCEKPTFATFVPTGKTCLTYFSRFAARWPTLAGLVPICSGCTLADLGSKYPTLATTTPGWNAVYHARRSAKGRRHRDRRAAPRPPHAQVCKGPCREVAHETRAECVHTKNYDLVWIKRPCPSCAAARVRSRSAR